MEGARDTVSIPVNVQHSATEKGAWGIVFSERACKIILNMKLD